MGLDRPVHRPHTLYTTQPRYDSPLCGYFSYLSRFTPLSPSSTPMSTKKSGKSKGEERPPPLCANAVDALIHHVVRAVAKVAPEVGRLRHKELRVYR